jgi:predicted nuclease of restriction endonuclease-like RecB superfamily
MKKTKRKKLIYYGGNGFESANEIGKFEVKYGDGDDSEKTKEFTSLTETKEFYKKLRTSKAAWDVERIPELLECHTLE